MLKVIGAGWSTMCFDNDHLHLSLLHQLISSFLLELGCWIWSLLLIWLSPHSPILSTNCALHFQKVTILCCCSCCSVGLLYFPIFPFPSSKSVVQVNLDHLTILRWHLEGDHKSQKGQLNSCFIHFYFLWNQFWQCQDLESSFSSCNYSLYTGPRILLRFCCLTKWANGRGIYFKSMASSIPRSYSRPSAGSPSEWFGLSSLLSCTGRCDKVCQGGTKSG